MKEYRLSVSFASGSNLILPENLAANWAARKAFRTEPAGNATNMNPAALRDTGGYVNVITATERRWLCDDGEKK